MPPLFTLSDASGRVLLTITPEGAVEGTISDAGDAGRVFMRSIKNALGDYLYERDRPATARAVERIHEELALELRRREEKKTSGLVLAMSVVRGVHPDKDWRMRH